LITLKGLPVTSHSIAQLRISSGISTMFVGSLEAGICFSTFGNGFSYSDHLSQRLMAFSFDKG